MSSDFAMMTRRRVMAVATAAACLTAAGTARAAAPEPEPFSEAAFDAAQKAGRPILVDTYATWCEVCARQAPILDRLRGEAKTCSRRRSAAARPKPPLTLRS